MTSKEILKITSGIGGMLIECGAEIYRVEDSINRIAEAYGFSSDGKSVEVFAIPSSLIITVNDGDEPPLTRTMRITNRVTNLDRVNKLNNLSRYVCTAKPKTDIIMRHLDEIRGRRVYGGAVRAASYGVVGATFALFFGGGAAEAVSAGAISLLIFALSSAVDSIALGVFFQNMVCSFAISAAAVCISKTGFTSSFENVIIGASMNLVPGITLTNCMRDFIAGDFLAGMYTLAEAVLIAVGMAVGAAAAISLFTII